MGETTPIYTVKVLDAFGREMEACLKPAEEKDMPPLNLSDWTFDWRGLWEKADFRCEAIIKLSFQEKVLGLVKFALYPYTYSGAAPTHLEISHLQCVSKANRLVNPVAFWLLWYAAQIALKYCGGDENGNLLTLDALEDAIPYYRDKVRMNELGWIDIAPGEIGYAFGFTKQGAKEFCLRVEEEYHIVR